MAAFSRRCVKCRNTIVLKQGNRPICLKCRRKPKPSITVIVQDGWDIKVVRSG